MGSNLEAVIEIPGSLSKYKKGENVHGGHNPKFFNFSISSLESSVRRT